jgi:hypothetical protein
MMAARYLVFFFWGSETMTLARSHKRPMKTVELAKGRSLDISHGMPSSSDRASMSSKL